MLTLFAKILGIIPLGTSLDYESERSRQLGCWQSKDALANLITNEWSAKNGQPTPDFAPSKDFASFLMDQGFGPDLEAKLHEFWYGELVKNYSGDEGRKRMRMAGINLRDRDGLHLRAADVVCPVLWLHVSSPFSFHLSSFRYLLPRKRFQTCSLHSHVLVDHVY